METDRNHHFGLLEGKWIVAKELSSAKETEPTESVVILPCASQVNSPARKKQAKARQKAARYIL